MHHPDPISSVIVSTVNMLRASINRYFDEHGLTGFLYFFQQGSSGNSPHVRALMQHIQMAVQAGYLNPQILNQPLAPTTLMLLNNMLSHINMLQKFTQQQAIWQAQAHINKNSSQTLLSLNVSITKTKQQIQNLQVKKPFSIYFVVFLKLGNSLVKLCS